MTDPRHSPTADTVCVERTFDAPPDRVYAAWLDPAVLATWMSPVGHAVVSVDARPGGRFRIIMVGEGRELEHVGRYRELVPGRRLVFTWRSPFTAGDSVVTVEIGRLNRGTAMTLVHERLPEDQVLPHTGGWVAMLDRLAGVLGGVR